MSALIVSSGHIDVLVHALTQYGVVPSDLGADALRDLGQMLWQENHTSVHHLSGDDSATPRYTRQATTKPLDPIAVLKAVFVYDYQSRDHPEWTGSEAHALMESLHAAILAQHPDLDGTATVSFGEIRRYRTLPAWENLPWGSTTLRDARLRST
ncbi:hypothetical protein NQK81_01425 [Amycolatopsis roodepoortensis]|uniref:hypothetical protein n=1 Tax=Amycolatopsis roodepoortensis TaxID=700274 RepID=UPI00214BBBA6|nr:hypothetical protein [Amycolatopsis roodepoortensis]UUV32136.1 hypothetical protein NQK81_01425 [Amycolatopsis roodepoortensis]